MGELEPDDSRDVTLADNRAPGEPPRTGPREGQTRDKAAAPDDGTDGEEPSESGRSWRDTERERQEGDIDDATNGVRNSEDDTVRTGSF
jgi:hypothetical protein